MSEKLRLTLTSQALERLIGGDTEVEMELRQGIASEFAKRHLKPALKEAVQKETAEFQKHVANAMTPILSSQLKELGINIEAGWRTQITLSDAIKEKIKLQAEGEIGKLVHEAIQAAIDKLITPDILERRIDQTVNMRIADQVRAKVDKIVAAVRSQP